MIILSLMGQFVFVCVFVFLFIYLFIFSNNHFFFSEIKADAKEKKNLKRTI